MTNIHELPVHRACQENPFEDFSYDVQFAYEKASGGVSIEILNDVSSVILIEVRGFFTSAFSLRWFLPAEAQLRGEVLTALP